MCTIRTSGRAASQGKKLCFKEGRDTVPERRAVQPMMIKMLKIAEPTIVPTPRLLGGLEMVLSASDTNSSGAEDPAAIKVAPIDMKNEMNENVQNMGTTTRDIEETAEG